MHNFLLTLKHQNENKWPCIFQYRRWKLFIAKKVILSFSKLSARSNSISNWAIEKLNYLKWKNSNFKVSQSRKKETNVLWQPGLVFSANPAKRRGIVKVCQSAFLERNALVKPKGKKIFNLMSNLSFCLHFLHYALHIPNIFQLNRTLIANDIRERD